ncbi:hypothetical protein IWZ03DRAFT_121058 [Phyllosticta citriasiana]|uniref:Uncharacterized protein n=1 Tax=Phyllosticta citriasiana TaxID=595635 RepID=A0ABR1KWI4_9PEZI
MRRLLGDGRFICSKSIPCTRTSSARARPSMPTSKQVTMQSSSDAQQKKGLVSEEKGHSSLLLTSQYSVAFSQHVSLIERMVSDPSHFWVERTAQSDTDSPPCLQQDFCFFFFCYYYYSSSSSSSSASAPPHDNLKLHFLPPHLHVLRPSPCASTRQASSRIMPGPVCVVAWQISDTRSPIRPREKKKKEKKRKEEKDRDERK